MSCDDGYRDDYLAGKKWSEIVCGWRTREWDYESTSLCCFKGLFVYRRTALKLRNTVREGFCLWAFGYWLFILRTGYCFPTTKRSCFCLRMATTVYCWESVGSLKNPTPSSFGSCCRSLPSFFFILSWLMASNSDTASRGSKEQLNVEEHRM